MSCGPALCIVEGPGGEHGDESFEPAVGHAAQGSSMRVSAGTHGGVTLLALRIEDDANPRPVVESVTQPLVDAAAHEHDFLFAALAGDGRGSAVAAQGVVISIRDGL